MTRRHTARPHSGPILSCLLLALGWVHLMPGLCRAQSPPPRARWQTIQTPHFRVTYAAELEPLAQRTAFRAERAYASLSLVFTRPPKGRIDILLLDNADDSNGFAMPFPSNRITLLVRPPVDSESSRYYREWIDLVLTHELTHIFHLDRAGRGGRLLRRLFGRPPFSWPLFPVIGTPVWSIEGTAVFYESKLTGFGRIPGRYHEMVLRAAVLEDSFDPVDRIGSSSSLWPAGARPYVYGSMFLDYLDREVVKDPPRDLTARTAAAIVPPVLAYDRIAKKTLGRSFTSLYGSWRESLESRYASLAESLSSVGWTETVSLTGEGYYALHPRVSPDGRTLAYACADGRSDLSIRMLDLDTGRIRTLARSNGLAGFTWLRDGQTLLASQPEFADPYHTRSDLCRIDVRGGERRLTTEARLQDPDVAAAGGRVVAVQNGGGTTWLVLCDEDGGNRRVLTPPRMEVNWSAPRWSPEGGAIVAERSLDGMHDVVLLDTLGTVQREITHDRAVDTGPAWSPDGRWILFSSDRSGVPNLYAAPWPVSTGPGGGVRDPLAPAALWQVTSLLTGAFQPEVSQDGKWIYLSVYHADGYHIEKVPFDPSQWHEVSVGPRDDAAVVDTVPGPVAGRAVAYSHWRSVLPTYWVPAWVSSSTAGNFYGLSTSGADLLDVHSYGLSVLYNPKDRRVWGGIRHTWAGLGNPVLGWSADRSWNRDGRVRLQDGSLHDILKREDGASMDLVFLHPRMRWNLTSRMGVEGTQRRRTVSDLPGAALRDFRDDLLGFRAGLTLNTSRGFPRSISRERGAYAYVLGRRLWDTTRNRGSDGTYSEARADFRLYRGFHVFGFASHVLALRAAGLWRSGPGAPETDIGGVRGGSVDAIVTTLNSPGSWLPVRGFEEGIRWGSRAWSANLEYRLPVASVARGYHQFPVFLDQVSAAVFLDAGDAWCRSGSTRRFVRCEAGPLGSVPAASPLVGAGAELALDTELFFGLPLRLRGGVGFPVRGPGNQARGYVTFGSSF